MTSTREIDDDMVARFRRDGFLRIEQFYPAERVDRLHRELAEERAAHRSSLRDGDPRYTFTKDSTVEIISNVWRFVDGFSDMSVHEDMAAVAAQLMPAERIRVYHDSLLWKSSGGKAVPWHQDEYYALIDDVVTAWMPLVPTTRERGALIYAGGSHRDELMDIRAMSDDEVDEALRERGYRVECVEMEAGDVLFHSGKIMHRSDGNVTDTDRGAFTVFFHEDGRRLRPQPYGRAIVDLVYFPGRSLGDVADSELNPVVYAGTRP